MNDTAPVKGDDMAYKKYDLHDDGYEKKCLFEGGMEEAELLVHNDMDEYDMPSNSAPELDLLTLK